MDKSRFKAIVVIVSVGLPGLAHAGAVTPMTIYFNAAPTMQAIMVALVAAMVAAVVVTIRKLSAGRLTGGSPFLSSLRAGGPLLGLLGAAFNGAMISASLAVVGPVPLRVMAPGLAEIAMLIFLGLLTGVVAVIGHWAVEARIDRTVLKG